MNPVKTFGNWYEFGQIVHRIPLPALILTAALLSLNAWNQLGQALRRTARVALILASMLLVASPAMASPVSQPRSWGLGLMLGSPVGITVKHWTGGANAWDIGLGFGGFGVGPGFRLHADYLWGLAQLLPNPKDTTLDLYLGVGPLVGTWRSGWCGNYFDRRFGYSCGSTGIFGGGRIPLGLDLRLEPAPIELGLELAPGVVFSRGSVFGMLDAFLFVRILF